MQETDLWRQPGSRLFQQTADNPPESTWTWRLQKKDQKQWAEPVFLNVYEAPESIPRN